MSVTVTCQITPLDAPTNHNHTPILLPHSVLADVNGGLTHPGVLVVRPTLHTNTSSFNPQQHCCTFAPLFN